MTAGTMIGVDVGTKKLIVAAPHTADYYADDALEIKGDVQWKLTNQYADTVDDHPASADDLGRRYNQLVIAQIDIEVERLIAYANQFESPWIGVKDLPQNAPAGLAECVAEGRDLPDWVEPTIIDRIIIAGEEAGIPVDFVDAYRCSKTCGWCGESGVLARSGVFHCNNDDCEISGVDGDRNTAVVIARRGADAAGILEN